MIKNILEYLNKLWYAIVNKDYDRVVNMKEEVNRNIVENSYYMINLFIENKKMITNLKLQKLMYFVEAYYMAKNPSEDKLFDCAWSAWNYGPVVKELYQMYKKFGSLQITITEREKSIGKNLPKINIKCIEKIYEVFGGLSAFDLVTLTHLKGSPWSEVYEENQKNNRYDFNNLNNSDISKIATKSWFEDKFNFIFTEDK